MPSLHHPKCLGLRRGEVLQSVAGISRFKIQDKQTFLGFILTEAGVGNLIFVHVR